MNYSGFVKMKENAIDYIESRLKSTPIAMIAPEMKQNTDNFGITRTCAVLGCEDSKKLSSEEFFRFPEDSGLRQIWTDLTGRNNWTPNDYSYVCIQHFSVDCFMCDSNNDMILTEKAVPSLKLPRHVLEVEYIDEDSLDHDSYDYIEEDEDEEMAELDEPCTDCEKEDDQVQSSSKKLNGSAHEETKTLPEIKTNVNGTDTNTKVVSTSSSAKNLEVLELFTEVQMMQRKAVALKDKLKLNMKLHNRQSRFLNRLKDLIEMKKNILNQKRKKKARILLTLQDKIKDDSSGLVMAMPSRHTEDLKNFALSIYKYSPQAYIYARNTLRTMLPSTEVLDSWINAGFTPKNLLSSSNLIKVSAEQTESELSCKIMLRSNSIGYV